MNKDSVSENLIKINVFYTSLNEKFVEDTIDYSLEVKDLSRHILQSKLPLGRKLVQRVGRLPLPLAWRLLLQPSNPGILSDLALWAIEVRKCDKKA